MSDPFIFGTVLAGYDGSARGRDALRLAELLARSAGTRLLAVLAAADDREAPRSDAGLASELDELLPSTGVPFESRVVKGPSPARVLHELAAADGHVGLLVLGSTHHLVIGGRSPGSVAAKLLNGAPCPVAVAPGGYAGNGQLAERLRVIAVAFDGSSEARRALALAEELGLRCEATLRVVAVEERPRNRAYAGAAAPGAAIGVAMRAFDLEAELHAAVAELQPELRALPVFERRHPVEAILGQVGLGVDLLVMGSRGYGPVLSVLLGSVSSEVIVRAGCPTLVVPRGAT